MAYFLYASFPNSRNKIRSPTVTADTYIRQVNFQDDPNLILVAEANQNRTYVIVKNLDNSDNIFYIYATTLAIDPSAVATFGVPNDLIYNSVSQILYQKQDTGITTNWTVVTIDQVGFTLEPFQSATLDSLQDIYVATAANGAPAAGTFVNIDQGQG